MCVDWSVTLRDDPEIEVPSCLQFLTQCPSFSWIHLPSICPACPSVPDPVSSGRVFKELASAHPSEEDNKIKIKYVLPASNFNLHMHGEDDSNPWRCCSQAGRCCCPRLIAWPLILAWQPVSSSLKLFSKLLYWCEEEEQSQVQTLNDRDALLCLATATRCCELLLCCWRSNLNVVLMNAPQYLAPTVIIIVSSYLLNFIFGRFKRSFRATESWSTRTWARDRRNVISNPFWISKYYESV